MGCAFAVFATSSGVSMTLAGYVADRQNAWTGLRNTSKVVGFALVALALTLMGPLRVLDLKAILPSGL